jgi:hypothetical protein
MLKGDVLFVSGSLRRGSYNTALLREAANALPSGVDHEWLDGTAALPPYGGRGGDDTASWSVEGGLSRQLCRLVDSRCGVSAQQQSASRLSEPEVCPAPASSIDRSRMAPCSRRAAGLDDTGQRRDEPDHG